MILEQRSKVLVTLVSYKEQFKGLNELLTIHIR